MPLLLTALAGCSPNAWEKTDGDIAGRICCRPLVAGPSWRLWTSCPANRPDRVHSDAIPQAAISGLVVPMHLREEGGTIKFLLSNQCDPVSHGPVSDLRGATGPRLTARGLEREATSTNLSPSPWWSG